MKYIDLPSGQTVTLDDQDYERFGHYKWYWAGSGVSRNATRAERAAGSANQIILAREILGLPRRSGRSADATFADHVDGDRLNATRANLRPVSPMGNKQNCANYSNRKGRTSRYRGVSLQKGKWVARARFDGKNHHLGVFATELEAANAAQLFRLTHMHVSNEARHPIDRAALREAQALARAREAEKQAPCRVDGCASAKHSKGYCGKHYARLRRYGSTELPQRSPAATFIKESAAYRAHRQVA